jgi:hypothetical protein
MPEIFVFGSNLEGIHGKGAAKFALEHHGAKPGQGFGLMGTCYAIPTKETPYKSMGLLEINTYVAEFMLHSQNHKDNYYIVTPIGTGLAGHSACDIAPMFRLVVHAKNVKLPAEFEHYLKDVPWF